MTITMFTAEASLRRSDTIKPLDCPINLSGRMTGPIHSDGEHRRCRLQQLRRRRLRRSVASAGRTGGDPAGPYVGRAGEDWWAGE